MTFELSNLLYHNGNLASQVCRAIPSKHEVIMPISLHIFIFVFLFICSGVLKKTNDNLRLIITTIMGLVFGYFIGVSFPSVSWSNVRPLCLLDEDYIFHSDNCIITILKYNNFQIAIPSSFVSSFDTAHNDDHHSLADRSFPENLGSGSTPTTPKVVLSLLHVHVYWMLLPLSVRSF